MANNKYDIFISYRRQGGAQYARILQLMLAQRGYKVFLDYDELKEGRFGDRIINAIDQAPIFMLVLSKGALERCANDKDWVREEVMYAYSKHKHFLPVNPDKTYDGIKADIPAEIKEVAEDIQHSEIDFGQALGVTVDLMIRDRIMPVVGKRSSMQNVDTDGESAQKSLLKQERHNKFVRRITLQAAIAVVIIVLATCVAFFVNKRQKDARYAYVQHLTEMRTYLEDKYKDFRLQLSPRLSPQQMATIDTILINMSCVKPGSLWMSQYEFTVGQWYGILGGKYPLQQKNMPMTDVSYGEINMTLLDSLRNITNIEFDLPTAEEWQYAAHGGSNHETTTYSGSDDADKVAWYRDNSGGHAHPSDGQQGKEPNTLDLYDMSGNVSELCNTPILKGIDNVQYTVCGGNYNSPKQGVTATSEQAFPTDRKDKTVGFRIVIRKQ